MALSDSKLFTVSVELLNEIKGDWVGEKKRRRKMKGKEKDREEEYSGEQQSV